MRVAITGATGFLGRAVVAELAARPGTRLTLLGRDGPKLSAAFGPAPFTLAVTDYSEASLKSAVAACDAVIHLAAKRYQSAERQFSQYYENVRVAENLLGACAALGTPAFVLASTCSIYSERINRLPFREDDRVAPRNAYALSKLVVEGLADLYPRRAVALRLAQLIGLGEREGFLVATFIRHALDRRPLTVFGQGRGARDYLYVRDAARAIVRAVEAPDAAGIFNIGSGVGTSPLELAQAARELLSDNASPIVFDASKPDDPAQSVLDIARARERLGWAPSCSLREAFREMRKVHDAPPA